MAGLRNEAAHGEFDTLNEARAKLMEQQVNLFLARLSSLLDSDRATGQDSQTPSNDYKKPLAGAVDGSNLTRETAMLFRSPRVTPGGSIEHEQGANQARPI